MTVCSTSGRTEKHVGKNTGCSWYKFSEFKSLETSDSEQRNEWVQGNGKLGNTSEGFHQYNKLGSVRHECELQGVMTS